MFQHSFLPAFVQRYSWAEIEDIMKFLAPHVGNYFEGVADAENLGLDDLHLIAIGRGGMLPALLLSHMLKVPISHVLSIKAYKNKQLHPNGIHAERLPKLTKKQIAGAIFVDDIIDSGITAKFIRNEYPGAVFIAPFGKIPGVNLIGQKYDSLICPIPIVVADNIWIEFPWECPTVPEALINHQVTVKL